MHVDFIEKVEIGQISTDANEKLLKAYGEELSGEYLNGQSVEFGSTF